MKMVDLGEKPYDGSEVAPAKESKPEKYYPRIYLGTDQTKDLGLDGVQVGAEFTMVAKVRVKSVQSSEHEGGKKRTSVDLCIEQATLEAPKAKKDVAEVMYPEQGK